MQNQEQIRKAFQEFQSIMFAAQGALDNLISWEHKDIWNYGREKDTRPESHTHTLMIDLLVIASALGAGYSKLYWQISPNRTAIARPDNLDEIRHMAYCHVTDIRKGKRVDEGLSVIYVLDLTALSNLPRSNSWNRPKWFRQINANTFVRLLGGLKSVPLSEGKGNKSIRRYSLLHPDSELVYGLEDSGAICQEPKRGECPYRHKREIIAHDAIERMIAHYNTVKTLPHMPVVINANWSEAMDNARLCGQIILITPRDKDNQYCTLQGVSMEYPFSSYGACEAGLRQLNKGSVYTGRVNRNQLLFDLATNRLGHIQEGVKDLLVSCGITGRKLFA